MWDLIYDPSISEMLSIPEPASAIAALAVGVVATIAIIIRHQRRVRRYEERDER